MKTLAQVTWRAQTAGSPVGADPRAAVLLALLVQHLLEVGAVLHELVDLEVATAAPDLLERVDLAHREVGRLAVAHARESSFW
jgi:hypothetical protein